MNNTERADIIGQLSTELQFLETQLETVKDNPKEYRLTLKSYNETVKLYLKLVAERDADGGEVDALTAFNAPERPVRGAAV